MTITTSTPIVDGFTPQTYTDLQTLVGNYMARSDLTGDIPGIIRMAEYRLNREVVSEEYDTLVTGVVDSNEIDVSDLNAIDPLGLWLRQEGCREIEIPKGRGFEVYTISSAPSQWEWITGSIQFDCPLSTAWTFRFRLKQKFQLSEDNPTNWLLENHADVYLAAALMWGGGFTKDFPYASVFKSILDEGIPQIQRAMARMKRSIARVDPAITASTFRRGQYNGLWPY